MVSWAEDGSVSGFDPLETSFSDTRFLLASPGSVDLNGITRLQYNHSTAAFKFDDLVGNLPIPDRISAIAPIFLSSSDISSNPNRRFTVTMFVAPASLFDTGVEPTPAQILARGPSLMAYRSAKNVGQSGTHTFTVRGPRANLLQANTKYWILVIPTKVINPNSPANYINDKPIASANGSGRALSLWTNRTPLAPTITSPSPGVTVPAGTELTFSFTPNDPDLIVGNSSLVYSDLAGVEIQYAARPTSAEPSPTWVELPITDHLGTVLGRGWHIDGTVSSRTYQPNGSNFPDSSNLGATTFWQNLSMPLLCGSNAFLPFAGSLPSGDWQIRMRVFDYGHPMPVFMRAFVQRSDQFSVADAPASNTSPWSVPLNITVSAQVPPPIPASPINDNAIPLGTLVTLTWQYRNTFVPPYAQKARTIQIRKIGETAWTTLVSGNSASPSYTITGAYPVEATTHYEWRVQVTDMDNVVSNYSSVARFWVVPEPASGETRPVPLETINGATLGCGTHRVFVYRRGGTTRVGEIHGISHLDWNRVRDDISDAKIIINDWDIDGGTLLGRLQTWAYEIVIFRDNGYSVDRVWEGPITRLTYERDSVTIHAQDVMVLAYRRIVKQAINDSGKGKGRTVTARAANVLLNAFAPDDPNVLSYLQVLSRPDDAMQYRNLPPFSRTAFEEIDDMAANAGLDYTVVGRAILLWGTRHRIGTLPEFRDDDLGSTPIVSEYGMSFANFYSVSDGNGVHGDANRLDANGQDLTYGLVEMLSSSWASDSGAESGTYTEAGLATIIESFKGFAEKSIADRFPPPVIVRVPDNTTLNPDVAVSIQQFVPGVLIPLRSNGTLRSVVTSQKLDSMTVTEESGNENITIVMSPFSSDDTEVVAET